MESFGQELMIGVPATSPISLDWEPVIVAVGASFVAAMAATATLAYWIQKRRRRSTETKTTRASRPAAKAA